MRDCLGPSLYLRWYRISDGISSEGLSPFASEQHGVTPRHCLCRTVRLALEMWGPVRSRDCGMFGPAGV